MSSVLSAAASALIGAWVVYLFALRKLAAERRSEFLKRQLSELYSPLAATRKLIRAKSELRIKIRNAVHGMIEGPDRFQAVKSHVDYSNQQLETELVPLYRKMLEIFTEKYWLADPDTRAFYQNFLEFVEIWNHSLAKPISPDVAETLAHDEDKLQSFYDHLEQKLTTLQNHVKDECSWRRLWHHF